METFYLDCKVCFSIKAESIEEAQKKLWLNVINNEEIRKTISFEDCEIIDIFTTESEVKKE